MAELNTKARSSSALQHQKLVIAGKKRGFTLSEIRRMVGQPRLDGQGTYQWRDFAVLCRSLKREAKAIESELDRLEVPYRVQGNAGFYRNPAVAFLVNYILALVDEEDDRPLQRVLGSPVPGMPQVAVARFLNRVIRRNRHAGKYLWFMRFLMEREDEERWRVFRPGQEDDAEAKGELDAEKKEHDQVRAPYFFQLMTPEEKDVF